MTLAQIMTLALRQLDEDVQDLHEYEDVFRVYANIGHDIAVREYLRPKAWLPARTDKHGEAPLDDNRIIRVMRVREAESGREAAFRLLEDGSGIALDRKNAKIEMLCEMGARDMMLGTDEPMLPRRLHSALADYICYRHLSCGSMAKQERAQVFLAAFIKAMSTLRPQGMGSTKGYRNLYTATDITSTGGRR